MFTNDPGCGRLQHMKNCDSCIPYRLACFPGLDTAGTFLPVKNANPHMMWVVRTSPP